MSCCIENTRYNLCIWQGETFGLTVTVKDINGNVSNITGYSARMQIREAYDSPTATETLTTANGEITITGAEGNVAIELAATRTANIYVDLTGPGRPPKKTYVYDLELIDTANVVSKLLYGDALVYAEVTK
jgi:hypothetical protein